MMEHASEVIPFLITILAFLSVYVLNGIKGEITEVKERIKSFEIDLRAGVTSLDRRISRLEGKCNHNGGCDGDEREVK